MLQMRARSFALRDKFADALSGLIIAEEVQDYSTPLDVTPKTQSISSKLDSVLLSQEAEVKANDLHTMQEEDDTEVSTPLTRLMSLITTHNVPNEVIDKWCNKAGVKSVALLDEEKQESCIEWINKQFNHVQDMDAA